MNVQLDFLTQEQAFLTAEKTEAATERSANAQDILAAQAAIDAANAQMATALAKKKFLDAQDALIATFEADLAAAEPTTTTTAPTIVSVSSRTPDGTLAVGDNLTVAVLFSAPVDVTGTPQVSLSDGAVVDYGGGTGSTSILFPHVVASGETTNGNILAVSSIELNGGTIKSAGVDANLALPTTTTLGAITVAA